MSRAGLVGLLTAEAVSVTGSRLSMVALPWFVLQTSGSPALTGVATFAEMAPYVAVKLFGGPVIDRVGARRTSIAADTLSVLAIGAVPLLHQLGALPLPLLLVLMAVAGTVRAPSDMAKQVLLPGVAEGAGTSLDRAAGLHDSVNRLGLMLGAPLGGVLIAVLDAPTVLVLDAASFVIAALLIVAFVPLGAQPPRTEGTRYGEDLRAGWSFVRTEPLLRAIVTMVCATNLLDAAFSPLLVTVWSEQRYGSAAPLGLVLGVFSAGAVISALVASAWAEKLPRLTAYRWSFLLAGIPRFVVLALPVPLPVVVVVFAVSGLGAGFLNPFLAAAEYELIPRAMQARVLGVVSGLAWAGIPFGGLLAGFGVDTVGLAAVAIGCGVAYLLVTLDPFLRPVWRDLERGGGQGRAAQEPALT